MGKHFKIEKIIDVEKPDVPFFTGFISGVKVTAAPAIIALIALAGLLLIQSPRQDAPAPALLPAQDYPSN